MGQGLRRLGLAETIENQKPVSLMPFQHCRVWHPISTLPPSTLKGLETLAVVDPVALAGMLHRHHLLWLLREAVPH